jgi:hypothetical protein
LEGVGVIDIKDSLMKQSQNGYNLFARNFTGRKFKQAAGR